MQRIHAKLWSLKDSHNFTAKAPLKEFWNMKRVNLKVVHLFMDRMLGYATNIANL